MRDSSARHLRAENKASSAVITDSKAVGKNVGPAKILLLKIPANDAQAYPLRVEGSEVLTEV